MKEMKLLQEELVELLTEVNTYNEKPNKSLSGRIRAKLGKIKKDVTPLRSLLVEADKAGY